MNRARHATPQQIAHARAGVDVDQTKQQMAGRVGQLAGLTQKAIGLQQ